MTFATVMATKSPSAWWRLAETGTGTGTMVDSSGNSRNGTHTTVGIGAPTYWLLADGSSDGAIFYNGIGSYSEIADAAWMDASASFSIHALIQPSGVSGTQTILARYTGTFSTSQFTFRLDGNKLACYVFIGSGLAVATGTTSLTSGTIYRVGASYDGTTIKVYVNGTLDGSNGSASGINTSSTPMRLGRNTAGSNEWYTGWIDEMSIVVGTVWSATDFSDLNTAATTTGATQYAAAGTVAASSAVSGSATLKAVSSGTVAATTATTSSAAGFYAAASGTVAGTSALTGAATLLAISSGTVGATSGVTGSTTSSLGASGTVAAVSDTTGTALRGLAADGTVAVTSGTSADVVALLVAMGTVDALTALLGSATRRKVASGTVVVISGVRGAALIPQPPVDTPPARTLVVGYDNRSILVGADVRLLTVGFDNRTLVVATETRTVGVGQ